MGILDGSPDQGQAAGPQSPGILSRMQAQYAPGAYEAVQQAQRQRAVYDAAMQSQGMSPQIAQALAMSPQFFGAQQQAYLPQATQVTPVQQSDGSQTLLQTSNPGGSPGHGVSISGIPITEPPGTTQSPGQAAGAQGATPAADQGQGAPAPVSGPKTTLEGMPGSTQATLKQIEANKAAGVDPTAGLPTFYKGLAQAVLEGRETLKDITSQRGAATRNAVNAIVQTIEPNFDENMNEARNTYRKQYSSEKPTDVGGQVKSLNKLAGHAHAMADAAVNVDNIGLGGSGLAHPINAVGNYLYSTPAAGLKSAADKYVGEKTTYISGGKGGDKGEREERRQEYNGSSTPQEMGTALLSDIDFIEKQMQGGEQHQKALFPNDKLRETMPLQSPEAVEHLRQAKVQAHKLLGDFDQWSKSPEGEGAAGVANTMKQPGGLPPGWKFVK